MSNFLECEECHKIDATVQKRICGYSEELYETEEWEIVCDDCEQEHLNDI